MATPPADRHDESTTRSALSRSAASSAGPSSPSSPPPGASMRAVRADECSSTRLWVAKCSSRYELRSVCLRYVALASFPSRTTERGEKPATNRASRAELGSRGDPLPTPDLQRPAAASGDLGYWSQRLVATASPVPRLKVRC